MSAGFTLRLTNDHSEVARLIEKLVAFGHDHALSDRMISNVALALDELLTNVIKYGLPPADAAGGQHEIGATISLEHGRLIAEITDTGRPFNPFEEAPPPDLESALEDRRVGGLGVYLVKQLMDETAYRREGAVNHTRIVKEAVV